MKAVTGREMCRALERRGWLLTRIGGSHHVYTQPGNPFLITVPVHAGRTLATGTQHAIMRAAGLTEDDL